MTENLKFRENIHVFRDLQIDDNKNMKIIMKELYQILTNIKL